MRFQLIRLSILGVSTCFLPFNLGIDACNTPEICDGLDNDQDGLIDEGFDEDLDGYTSAQACPDGDDCNDRDPSVHPGTSEVADGIDNDCDGTIDESTQPYTFNFIGKYTRLPLEGVLVWTDIDGQGTYGLSDANGTVTLWLEGPWQTWSFAYHASYTNSSGGSPREDHRIYTYLSDTLEETQTLELITGFETPPSTNLTCTVTGIVPETDSSVNFYTNYKQTFIYPSTESVTTTVSERIDQPMFLFVAQMPPCPDITCPWFPERFAAVKNPASTVTMALDQTFDQTVALDLQDLDPSMTTADHFVDVDINPNDMLYFEIGRQPVTDLASREIPVPRLTGGLEGASMLLSAYVYNDLASQDVDFLWNSESGTKSVRLPPVLDLSDDYEPLSLETLSGTTIDLLNDTGADHEQMYYYLYQYWYNDAGLSVLSRNSWNVRSIDPSRPLTFAAIPKNLFAFVPASEPYNEMLVTGAAAAYGFYDEDPEVKWAGAEFALATPSSARAAVSSRAVNRMTFAERRTLALEDPVLVR